MGGIKASQFLWKIMNIFQLSTCPIGSAHMMVDRHVVKMILESAQILSTAHRVLDGELYIDDSTGRKMKRYRLPDSRESVLYKATHVNHPSSIWARETNNNYNWLYVHFWALCEEYTYRYGKIHACHTSEMFSLLSAPPRGIEVGYLKPVTPAMPEEYVISSDSVVNYRNYYAKGKKHLHTWTLREEPEWIRDYI